MSKLKKINLFSIVGLYLNYLIIFIIINFSKLIIALFEKKNQLFNRET